MTESLTLDELREIAGRMASLEIAVLESLGNRINRAQVRERIGKCDKTLSNWLKQGRFPKPVEGLWRVADIVEWERSKALRN